MLVPRPCLAVSFSKQGGPTRRGFPTHCGGPRGQTEGGAGHRHPTMTGYKTSCFLEGSWRTAPTLGYSRRSFSDWDFAG